MVDRILVLEDGQIVEAGSHEELVALGGRYATLYEMQAGRLTLEQVVADILQYSG